MTSALAIALAQFTGGPGHANDPRDGRHSRHVVISGGRRQHDVWTQQGYVRTHQFVALPSSSEPRWLLPLDGENPGERGFQIYTPYSPLGRVLKNFTMGMLKVGWKGGLKNRILVTSREPLPLEKLVTEVTGEPRPMFSLALGAEGRFRKLTAQVMRPNGEILGFIKLPLNDAATARIRHEASVLESLCKFPALRPHLPRVLHAGVWGAGYILFQSGGPAAAGGAEFGQAHHQFLGRLWEMHRTEQPGEMLVRRTAARWAAMKPKMDSQLSELGDEALGRAAAKLSGVPVPCGILHGDFAPWNTRCLSDGRLFVYDWESAEWNAPIGWDIFHFHVQVACLLNRRGLKDLPVRDGPMQRGSFWLYVLNSMCEGLEEEAPGNRAVEYRRLLLTRELARDAETRDAETRDAETRDAEAGAEPCE